MKLPIYRIENAASDFESRYPLTGICLETDKSRIFATDGRLLVLVPTEIDPKDTSGPVPMRAIKRVRKSGTKNPSSLRCHKNAVTVQSADKSSFETIRRPSGSMPDINKLVKPGTYAGEPDITIGIDVLEKLVASMRGKEGSSGLCLWLAKDGEAARKALLVASEKDKGPVALVMPWRTGGYRDAETALKSVNLLTSGSPEPPAVL